MLLVRNIRLPLTCPDPDAEAAAKALAILRVPARKAAHCGVAKLSVDARHGTPVLVYTIAVTLNDEGEEPALAGASPCVCCMRSHQNLTFLWEKFRWRTARSSWALALRACLRRCCWPAMATAHSCWNAALRWMSASGPSGILKRPAN